MPLDITYLGATLIASDEVVLHAFRAPDVIVVGGACQQAGLSFERVVESVAIPDAAAGPPGTRTSGRYSPAGVPEGAPEAARTRPDS